MAQINHIDKPPLFDGTSYDYWKKKMSTHLKSMNRKIWEIVKTKIEIADAAHSPPREEKKLQFNDIAINTLYDAIHVKIFEQIKHL